MSETHPTPRRALITGGASGFGLGTARALLARGAQVALGDIDSTRLHQAAQSLGSDKVLSNKYCEAFQPRTQLFQVVV